MFLVRLLIPDSLKHRTCIYSGPTTLVLPHCGRGASRLQHNVIGRGKIVSAAPSRTRHLLRVSANRTEKSMTLFHKKKSAARASPKSRAACLLQTRLERRGSPAPKAARGRHAVSLRQSKVLKLALCEVVSPARCSREYRRYRRYEHSPSPASENSRGCCERACRVCRCPAVNRIR